MAKTLKMTFTLENGRDTTLNLASPKEDLVRADVEPVMQDIVDKEALLVGLAKPTAIKGAVVREVNEQKLI